MLVRVPFQFYSRWVAPSRIPELGYVRITYGCENVYFQQADGSRWYCKKDEFAGVIHELESE